MIKIKEVNSLSLYIHIPFCTTKCNYCNFNTYAGLEGLIPDYVEALKAEIRLWGGALGRRVKVNTIFFGGGTPSLLQPAYVGEILGACSNSFDIDTDAEITVESNPGDLNRGLIRAFLSLGVNRLSIGVQSFNDAHLKALTRRHSAEEALQAYRTAKDAGMANVNLDLMYGLPRQTLDDWRDTLEKAVALEPEHLSLYALTLEEGTPLEKVVRLGEVEEPDPDLAADMYLLAEETLTKAGYRHYEISNWALPGRECRHNLTYWKNLHYLGFGAGAHSCLGSHRFWNLRRPGAYISRTRELKKRKGPAISNGFSLETLRHIGPVEDVEYIDEQLQMGETMMLGLRLEEGIDYGGFARRFGREMRSIYDPQIEELMGLGLLTEVDGSLRLTGRGRLLGNEVFLRFLPTN